MRRADHEIIVRRCAEIAGLDPEPIIERSAERPYLAIAVYGPTGILGRDRVPSQEERIFARCWDAAIAADYPESNVLPLED